MSACHSDKIFSYPICPSAEKDQMMQCLARSGLLTVPRREAWQRQSLRQPFPYQVSGLGVIGWGAPEAESSLAGLYNRPAGRTCPLGAVSWPIVFGRVPVGLGCSARTGFSSRNSRTRWRPDAQHLKMRPALLTYRSPDKPSRHARFRMRCVRFPYVLARLPAFA